MKTSQYFKLSILPLLLCLSLALFAEGDSNGSYDTASQEGTSTNGIDASAFGSLVIQSGGRLKPVDTFARNHLLNISHKSTFDKQSALTWLFDLLINTESAHERKVVQVKNDNVIMALGLSPNKKHAYSIRAISAAMQEKIEDVRKMYDKQKEHRSLVEKKIIDLYSRIDAVYSLSHSLSCLLPSYESDNEYIQKTFNVKAGEKVSLSHFLLQRQTLQEEAKRLSSKEQGKLNEDDQALLGIFRWLDNNQASNTATLLNIIPPPEGFDTKTWSSPWDLMARPHHSAKELQHLTGLENILKAALHNDQAAFDQAIDDFNQNIERPEHMAMELSYNNIDFFYKSLYFYIAAFLVLIVSFIGLKTPLHFLSFFLFFIGTALHGVGLYYRMEILNRPPVSTLYESIIFVGFMISFFCILIEIVKRDGMGIFIATSAGALLHFIGFSYADEGDTMGMLVAVLNSNFWLATHVVTITIGYGAAFVAGIIAHIYLIATIFQPNEKEKHQTILKNIQGTALVALFFTVLGTILGGIWADQSWGRFWGWDPKENGALLICLWLIFVIHGKIAGILGPVSYAANMILVNVCVAVAWFGVNLLNVGLHSYGFTDSIAMNLYRFCALECLFAFVCYFIIKAKLDQHSTKVWIGLNLLNVGIHYYEITGRLSMNILIFCILECVFTFICFFISNTKLNESKG
ncbi:MAG: cytochrome c biogenesis protein CcsA [Planctomycetes bacterium]|nr:cytochrome c biogenesis protein CcsA [Planctomycetota bacterium]